MPKTKGQKATLIANLADKIKKSRSIFFLFYHRLGVKDNENLRKNLRRDQSEYYVVKKTLLNRAWQSAKLPEMDFKKYPGQVAAVFSYGDEVLPAKTIAEFKKENEDKIGFLGGWLDGAGLDAVQVEAVSKLPAKIELYSRLVGTLNAPVSGLVNVLAGNLRGLVYALKAIGEKSNK
jgi:large subunit ribosomal protein L10